MRGTILCSVTDSDEVTRRSSWASSSASGWVCASYSRMSLRASPLTDAGDDNESVTMKADRKAGSAPGAARREHGSPDSAERRWASATRPPLLGQIAAEEAADLIVVGSRDRGWRGRPREPARRGARARPRCQSCSLRRERRRRAAP